MALFDPITKWLRGKNSLEDLSIDELRREGIRVEQKQNKIIKQVEELEEQKQELFLKGKDESSKRKKHILATKIKELDVQAKNLDKSLRHLSKQLRIVNGFVHLKENARLFEGTGIDINSFDLEELQQYVEVATADGQFRAEKLEEVLGTIEGTGELMGEVEEDEEILQIVEAMDDARLAELESPDAVEGTERERLDEILKADEEEPELGL